MNIRSIIREIIEKDLKFESFKDITDDMIPELVEEYGNDQFISRDEMIEDIMEKIHDYKKLSNPAILYRVVAVKNKKMIKTDELGEHYTPYKYLIDFDFLLSIGMDSWEKDWSPYIITVSVSLSDIDVRKTIVRNLYFPSENEVVLKDKGKLAKILKIEKIK